MTEHLLSLSQQSDTETLAVFPESPDTGRTNKAKKNVLYRQESRKTPYELKGGNRLSLNGKKWKIITIQLKREMDQLYGCRPYCFHFSSGKGFDKTYSTYSCLSIQTCLKVQGQPVDAVDCFGSVLLNDSLVRNYARSIEIFLKWTKSGA